MDTGENPYDPLGADVARIGLGAPPRPPLVGETPRPSGSGMEHGTGYSFWFFLSFSFSTPCAFADYLIAITWPSDSTISGWADVLEAIYKDIGGCLLFFLCYLFLVLCFYSWFLVRPASPPAEEHRLF